jgi:hypothetical protein
VWRQVAGVELHGNVDFRKLIATVVTATWRRKPKARSPFQNVTARTIHLCRNGLCRGPHTRHRKIETEMRATCHTPTLMPKSIGDAEFRFAISGQVPRKHRLAHEFR